MTGSTVVVSHPVTIKQPSAAGTSASEDEAAFETIVAGRLVHSVYQPIVELESGAIVGWEALARGPEGSPLQYPDRLFATAARLNRTAELDFLCRTAAAQGALDAGLGTGQELFVNIEVGAATVEVPDFAIAARDVAAQRLRVSVEITERDLMNNPAELMASLAVYRRLGWGVALDDVGIDPRSISLIPFVQPDVIKLDMSFVQQKLIRRGARAVHAYTAQAERSGTRILAEGIETAEHLAVARVLGAELGQGWYFGRPGQLSPGVRRTNGTGRIRVPRPYAGALTDTPFEVLRRVRPVHRATKDQLLQLSLALEDEAIAQGEAAVILSTFQEAAFFSAATKKRYELIARRAAFVGALARDLGEQPARGVRGVALSHNDALGDEWTVVVLAPHFAGAFAAHDLGSIGLPDTRRCFEYAVTHDRELVIAAATRLMQRLARSAP